MAAAEGETDPVGRADDEDLLADLHLVGVAQRRAVCDRYNIVSEDDLRAAVQKTSAYVDGLPSTPTVVPLPGIKRTAE